MMALSTAMMIVTTAVILYIYIVLLSRNHLNNIPLTDGNNHSLSQDNIPLTDSDNTHSQDNIPLTYSGNTHSRELRLIYVLIVYIICR